MTTGKNGEDPVVSTTEPEGDQKETPPVLKSTMIMTAANIAAMDGDGEGQTRSVSGVTSAGLEPVDLEALDEDDLVLRQVKVQTLLENLREDEQSAGTELRASQEVNDDAKALFALAEKRLSKAEEELKKAELAKQESEANLALSEQACRAAEEKRAGVEAKRVQAEEELKKAEDAIASRLAKRQAEEEREAAAAKELADEEERLAAEQTKLAERKKLAEEQRKKREASMGESRAAIAKLLKPTKKPQPE